MLVLIAGNAVQYLTAIVSVKLMTSILSPAEMGRVSIVTALALWFNVFYNGVGAYVQRNILAWDLAGAAVRYVKRFSVYMLFVSCAGTAALLVMHATLGIGIEISPYWLAVLIVGLSFFAYLNTGFVGWLNLFGRRGWFVFFSTVSIWAGLAFSAFFSLSRGRTAESWLFGQVAGQVCVLVFSTWVLFKQLKRPGAEPGPSPALPVSPSAGVIFGFAWPMSVASLLLWLQQSAYRFILEGIAGVEAVGLVAVGFGLGVNFMNRFEILFNQFYHPVFYKEISGGDSAAKVGAWNSYAYFLMPPALLLALYIIAGGPFLARIFVGDSFYEVTKSMIGWGVISQLVLIFMTIYSMAGIIEQKTTDFILPNVAGVIVMAGTLFSLARWNPYAGSGIALTAGSLAAMIVMRLKMKKLMPVHFPVKRTVFAAALAFPMVTALAVYARLNPLPNIFESVAVLAVTGFYSGVAGLMLVGRRLSLPPRLQFVLGLEERLEAVLAFTAKGS